MLMLKRIVARKTPLLLLFEDLPALQTLVAPLEVCIWCERAMAFGLDGYWCGLHTNCAARHALSPKLQGLCHQRRS